MSLHADEPRRDQDLTRDIIGGAIRVHRRLGGPGLLEPRGLLINFNVEVLKDGIKRVINTKPLLEDDDTNLGNQ